MFCYRDMTFCDYYKECKEGEICPRALTKKVIKEANKWMKNPPICQFAEKPDCFKGEKR